MTREEAKKTLEELEAMGYVTKGPDMRNGSPVYRLTPAGEKAGEKAADLLERLRRKNRATAR